MKVSGYGECQGCGDFAIRARWRVGGEVLAICLACRRRLRENDRTPETPFVTVEKTPEPAYSVIDEAQGLKSVDRFILGRLKTK